jgi:hypothetical protein
LLADYFRAPSVAAAQQQLTEQDGGSPLGVFDGENLKNLDPTVILGQFVALATGRPYSVDLIATNLIWEDPSSEGPWVTVFDDRVRDTLAGISADRLPALAEQWATIEEFHGQVEPPHLRAVAEQLMALASRAREAGEPLFCWMSL